MLHNIFQQTGTKVFLQTATKSYNYAWLQQKLHKTAGLFRSLNLKPGDRLLIAVSDDVEMSTLFLTALATGVTAVLADPELKAPRANAIATRSSPHCIIADKESLDRWHLPSLEGCTVLPFAKDSIAKPGLLSKFLQKSKPEQSPADYKVALEKATPAEGLPVTTSPDALAYIIFTSGTTADSKGVAITYGNLAAHLATLQKVYSLDDRSTLLNQLILCHADGCIQGPLLAAFVGCTWHRPFRFSIEKIPGLLDYCYGNAISHSIMVPAMLNMLVQFSDKYEDSFTYPQFKALISVSAHLEAPLWDKFELVFAVPVSNVYGLTETVAGSLFSGPLEGTRRKYTVGKPVDCEVRIVTQHGEDVKGEATGELCLKGAHIMTAYWKDEAATAEAFKEGWFYTGDLASKDEDGFITIKGRKKNLVISGGINIHPEEVTECLLQHADVSEACALGLPDAVFGERLVAAVVLKLGSSLADFALSDYCRQYLEEKKVPNKIFLLDSLPKGVSGKVQLNVLAEQLQQSTSSKPQTNGQFLDQVIAVAAESFQMPASRLTIGDTSNSVGGWDSLAHLLFITGLEEKFKLHFTTAEIITMNSIQKAVQLVEQKTLTSVAQ